LSTFSESYLFMAYWSRISLSFIDRLAICYFRLRTGNKVSTFIRAGRV
jgi:hypothetical protein